VITIHQRHRQTDGQTDRQTTCDRNTALCTKVHRAVKIEEKIKVWTLELIKRKLYVYVSLYQDSIELSQG